LVKKNTHTAQPGDEAKDLVTGFKGIITARTTWLHGCDRLSITPTKLGSDGTPIKESTFDEQRIEVIRKGKVPAKLPSDGALVALPLGAEAKDKVTGFAGIIAALTVMISGDIYVQIEPEKTKKDGDTFEAEAFHADRIEVMKPKPVPRAKKTATTEDSGGPQRGEDARLHR
jgi:hypothetical protein